MIQDVSEPITFVPGTTDLSAIDPHLTGDNVAVHPVAENKFKEISMRGVIRFFVTCNLLAACLPGFSQSPSNNAQPAAVVSQSSSSSEDGGPIGVGVKISTLGVGGEVAMRVTHRTNVRAGFNAISYNRDFNKDGIAYAGQLSFKTFEAHYDIFPFARSFHISPGVLVYAGDPITATASVPGNQTFSLGGTTYYSDPTNPITGSGKIDFNRAAPTITIGSGNLVPRKEGKHFSIPFEIGVAFQGSPKATLGLGGNACDAPGVNCVSAATNSGIQSNIVSEQNKINSSMSFFKAYPIISAGFGYRF
jgi:hypothetical protein